MSSSTIPTTWTSEEKIHLLLTIIELSQTPIDWLNIVPPAGRDIASSKLALEGLVTKKRHEETTINRPSLPASVTAPSFTPANKLKRTHDDISGDSNAGSPSTTYPQPPTSDETTPAKKKRGRPPKVGGPAEQRAQALARGEEIPKKKRGRPPKVRPDFPPSTLAAASVAPGTIVKTPRTPILGPDGATIKRGRGRPSNAELAARGLPITPKTPRPSSKPTASKLDTKHTTISPDAKTMSTPESTHSPEEEPLRHSDDTRMST